jgi:putative membrane protein
VLSTAAGSQRSVDQLRTGVEQLRTGAHELSSGVNQAAKGATTAATGSSRLNDGVTQLTGGVKQLAGGLRTMDAKRVHTSELNRLKAGADELAIAHVELGKGLAELKGGSTQLREGVQTFRSEAKSSLLVPSSVVDGLDQVLDGATQLDNGLLTAVNAQHRMAAGASQLSTGVEALTNGMLAMNSGVRTMVVKLPQDRQLDELDAGSGALASGTAVLADGTQKIKAGVDRLTTGLDLLADSLPSNVDAPDGSAQGLANSVKPVLEVDAPVPNSGSGFAPNVLPAALWLGAGVAAFLIHVRVLPRHAQFFSRPAQAMGKMAIPAVIVLSQAAILLATVMLILQIPIVHPIAFTLTLGVSALTFLAIVFALTRAFGDAGKALAMIFLAVQLSSSGGVLPVELSGGVFANISPWLPLTWVVRAIKTSMFGAYGGAWGHPLLIVTLGGVIAVLCASWVGRWRFVKQSSVRPAVDF